MGAMIYLPLRVRQGGRRGRREEGAFKDGYNSCRVVTA
jgi:hypothetical protein